MTLKKFTSTRHGHDAWIVAVSALLYSGVGWVSLTLVAPFSLASPIFPSAGLALAMSLRWKRTGLLGVWLGALLLNLLGPWVRELNALQALQLSCLLACAAALQARAGAWLLNRFLGLRWYPLRSLYDGVVFLLLGGLLSGAISAMLSLGGLSAWGLLPADDFWSTACNWYLGDALGVMLFTSPCLSLLYSPHSLRQLRAWRVLQMPMLVYLFCVVVLTESAHVEQLEQRQQFNHDNDLVVQKINDRLITHREVLAAIGRFIEFKPDFTPQDFERLTLTSLRDNPDIFALSYNPQISQAQRPAFERELQQRTHNAKAGITERNAEKQLQRAGQRARYVSVQDIVPLAHNLSALGYDIASDALRQSALAVAEKSGKMSVTAPLKLVQEKQEKRGILALYPIPGRSASNAASTTIVGYAVAVVKVDELLALALHDLPVQDLQITLTDAQAPQQQQVLALSPPLRTPAFASTPAEPSTRLSPLQQTHTLSFGQREWHLTLQASPNYMRSSKVWQWSSELLVLLAVLLACLVEMAFDHRNRLLKERAQTFKALKESYSDMIDSSPLPILVYSAKNLRILMINQQATALYGWKLGQHPHLSLLDFLPSPARHEEAARALHAGQGKEVRELQHVTQSGARIDVRSHSSDIEYLNFFARMEIIEDISKLKELEYQRELANTVFHHCSEAIVITDKDNLVLSANPAFSTITGYAKEELIGQHIRQLKSGHHDTAFYLALWQHMAAHGRWEGEVWNRHKNGDLYLIYLRIVSVNSMLDSQADNYVASFTDITQRKKAQQAIEHLAFHDPLTQLVNRQYGHERLESLILLAERNSSQLAVIFVDLDKFKQVNDVHGHAQGDHLLQQVAQRLLNAVRKSDMVCRLSGDEFVVVLDEVRDVHAATLISQKILELFALPFNLAQASLQMSCSLGLAIYPHDGQSAQALIGRADLAMYEAKKEGRNTYRFFDVHMDHDAALYLAQVAELRKAFSDKKFELHYQAQIELHQHQLVGMQALVCWNHPERGLLTTQAFGDTAEECGLMQEMGEWVLRAACEQAVAWQQRGLPALRMVVPIASLQLQRGNLVQTVYDILNGTGLQAQYLELELPQGTLMAPSLQMQSTLESLRALGVGLSVHDFGTGYASLKYLQQLKVGRVKMDRSFVCALDKDAASRAVVKAILDITQRLQVQTIAEGVEHEDIEKILRSMGCAEAQGALYGTPLKAQAFAKLYLPLNA